MHSFKTFIEQASLEYHSTLNPKLFDLDTGKLLPEVRTALMKFCVAWADYCNIPVSEIQDYYMTGGNANYNYTSQSDIDCHVVFDRRALGIPSSYLDDYLQDKKTVWQAKHHASVRGYPLEPYAQDASERFPANQGVYSLSKDDWIIKPEHGMYNFEHDPVLWRKVESHRREIDRLLNHHGTAEAVKALKDKLNMMRSEGLEKAGEFSQKNLIFKALRNEGYLDRLKSYEENAVDQSLSLP